jgi:hypothetical protein
MVMLVEGVIFIILRLKLIELLKLYCALAFGKKRNCLKAVNSALSVLPVIL